MKEIIAHVKQNPDGSWAIPQNLQDHLMGTAELSAAFARSFDSESWGYAIGIAHDSGKAPKKWQKYLRKKSGYGYDEEAHLENIPGKLEHSAPGAKLAEEIWGQGIGRILSFCIAGHHSGLPDWSGSQSTLAFRLQQAKVDKIPDDLRSLLQRTRIDKPPRKFDTTGLDLSFWIRMLFSCLVDADFLDTERYMDSGKHKDRGGYISIQELLIRFNSYMENLSRTSPDTKINRIRQTVLSDCRKAALLKPGFFSLTVPTGGGKTLSSMAFSLDHAALYRKDRIIYVIPYTSIIEQNTDVFRCALGTAQVVEHHSNLNEDDLTAKARLAAENWDAPVIVTTSVQFFESLFSAKSSRCRKLHNICNSVIILDEAQLLPAIFLDPILRTMELLVEHYQVSFVICTATQPALEKQEHIPEFPGIAAGSIREIVQDVPSLYRQLKRVNVKIPDDLKTPRTWEDLSAELQAYESVLCIVSDRKSCKELFHLMPHGTYHLSALMCAQHRSELIKQIKADLQAGVPTRVISTQLVEAGVDMDFPVVYRAIAGLDSIAQAAGRCNREGRLNENEQMGRVVLFVPPKRPPSGILRKAQETAVRILSTGIRDPIDQSVFYEYFSELYWKVNSLDDRDIIKRLTPDQKNLDISFRTAGEAFKIIDDTLQRSILVPYGEGDELITLLKNVGPERWLLRKLQRFTVNIYRYEFDELLNRGSIHEISPGIFSLICNVEYDDNTGLKTDSELFEPESYISC
ncbi:CRISPR-associated endonuclease Cas3'' [Marispirochaeta aestuarii]|uniref:CRISPR-associated endonuclease Cas3 n=1 Tax=Marispirochaeta aestuarii TaxID=1963862 RepID=A0A1Y1RUS9_9SPIO|nr:CRISPR-associated endonuclease Cas3'' [Marispirochaeta aestuarii]ORC32838.1 CRISPR-associated endonuclease Cas3'' [Marispirochaeta aestuarii]